MSFNQYLHLARGRIWLSYIFDWVIIIIFLGIGGALSYVEPIKRDFSLTDKAISFPYRNDTISVFVLFLVAVLAPAAIIALVCLLFVRLPTNSGSPPTSGSIWRRKLWEWHAGWLGLALSIALSLLLTQTMKNMFGKHRPDFLARCNPDIANMDQYIVGGFTSEILEGTSQLVNWEICISKNGSGVGTSQFIDGFRSFPSGHCTIAFAGLAYLSLFLATKLSATIPSPAEASSHASPEREEAAAPPLYLLVIVLIPAAAAVYIASTRFTDNKHAGFDVLFGSLEGLVCAWFALRMYMPPLYRAGGWAWAPRRQSAAFGIGIGVGSLGAQGHYGGKRKIRDVDVESGVHRRTDSEGTELHNLAVVDSAGAVRANFSNTYGRSNLP